MALMSKKKKEKSFLFIFKYICHYCLVPICLGCVMVVQLERRYKVYSKGLSF